MPSRRPLHPTRLLALLALGLISLGGCYGGRYDDTLEFGVRTDLIVNPNGNWEQQPTGFYHPGILPLDALKSPREKELSGDILNLKKEFGKKILDPAELPAEVRAEYGKNLREMFGKPAAPKVAGLDPAALKKADDSLTPEEILKVLRLDEATLAEGSRLYRQECLHCHGLEGNGRGPTGYWVNPPPRDYRSGIFKFTSSTQDQNARKPRREDLLHVLTSGIEGTSMPSFGLLRRDDLEALASYVIFLSLRGEAEYTTMLDQIKEKKPVAILRTDELPNATVRQAMEDNLALSISRWVGAQKPDAAVKPEPYTYADTDEAFIESAARGARLFLGAGGCISCHQNYGRESNLVYDTWGTIIRGRNLYDGIYRGGRRPIDLYYRIHGGINGAGMTSYKDINATIDPKEVGLTPEQKAQMKVDYLWDLVNFLKAMPYADLRVKLREKLRDQYKDERVLIPD